MGENGLETFVNNEFAATSAGSKKVLKEVDVMN